MASRVLFVSLCVALLNAAYAWPTEVEEKPAFDCPNDNEYFEKCELAVCYKFCKHLTSPPPCPSIATGCYEPMCLCKDNYLRDENGKCIPVEECKEYPIQQKLFGRA